MPIDLSSAERFVHESARLLERLRLARLLHDGPAESVLNALRAYRNPDRGFGNALEPDVRAPQSEVVPTHEALHLLSEEGLLEDALTDDAAAWVETVAADDGSLPALASSLADFPHAPWMQPQPGGSFLTMSIAGYLHEAGRSGDWLARATEWSWGTVGDLDDRSAYSVKFALVFLDRVPDEDRACEAIEGLRPRLSPDGGVAVQGGVEGERLMPLVLSPRPGLRSRAIFTDDQIESELSLLEAGQHEDGGWDFEFGHWSESQTLDWRGIATVDALATLRAHGRL
jgi:hypothetical protein